MGSQINDLVAMGDIDTLYELMADEDDWIDQLDAAEGLVRLGDMRGLEFLISAEQSEDKKIRESAKEILDSPEITRKREEMEAEERRTLQEKIETARQRLQKGRKVFQYKMVYLPAGELLGPGPVERRLYGSRTDRARTGRLGGGKHHPTPQTNARQRCR